MFVKSLNYQHFLKFRQKTLITGLPLDGYAQVRRSCGDSLVATEASSTFETTDLTFVEHLPRVYHCSRH